jgi:hypothetical protein
MRHATVEEIIDYIDGKATEGLIAAVDDHVTSCKECADLKREMHALMSHLQEDAAFEPPADLLQWGVHLFDSIAPPERPGLRRIIASLAFDTFDQPIFAGVRLAGTPPRPLVFQAAGVDVHVKVEAIEANDRVTLVGQILSAEPRFLEKMPVKLESQGIVVSRTETNAVGEFAFEGVGSGTYHLSVDLPEAQITMFCVHRGRS